MLAPKHSQNENNDSKRQNIKQNLIEPSTIFLLMFYLSSGACNTLLILLEYYNILYLTYTWLIF